VAVNKKALLKMISIDEKQDGSNLWKMNAIQILALTVSFDIPLLDNPDQITQLNPNQRTFQLLEPPVVPECDPILLALLKIQESKKKQIIQAASEALGKVLKRQPSLRKQAIIHLMVNESSERHDVLVNSIEKITREYPELLEDRKIFMKQQAFVKILTGTMRSAVLKSLERYLQVAKLKRCLDDINAVTMSLFADADDVLSDISD